MTEIVLLCAGCLEPTFYPRAYICGGQDPRISVILSFAHGEGGGNGFSHPMPAPALCSKAYAPRSVRLSVAT